MIFVVEFPHQGAASAWFAFDEADFAAKVLAADPRPEWEIHDQTSARELLEMGGLTPEHPEAPVRFPGICRLAGAYGWDTPLYRADSLLGAGVFSPRAVSQADACAAALKSRLKHCLILWDETQAVHALEHSPTLNSLEGRDGREALRRQLVAMEVVEGMD